MPILSIPIPTYLLSLPDMETPTECQAHANGVPGGVLAEVLAATAKIDELQNFARVRTAGLPECSDREALE